MPDSAALIRQYQAFFQEADVNEDHELDWDEFYDALPSHVKQSHSQETIRSWFDTADLDMNGKVSLGEFVQWSLTAASLVTGSAVTQVFSRHSRSKASSLDEMEFTRVANRLGFGRQAHELFHEFSLSGERLLESKTISEASTTIRKSTKTMKSFIIAMAWDNTDTSPGMDTSDWSWTATDVESARRSLAALLAEKNGVSLRLHSALAGVPDTEDRLTHVVARSTHVLLRLALISMLVALPTHLIGAVPLGLTHAAQLSDVFEELDTSGDYYINKDEFLATMEMTFGFKGPRQVLHDIFDHCDDDGSGELTFEELHAWLNGSRVTKSARMKAVAQLSLAERVSKFVAIEQKLGRGGELDVKRLRRDLCAALKEATVRTTDLLDFWDTDGDGKLNKKEWLRSWKKLVGVSDKIWYSCVRYARRIFTPSHARHCWRWHSPRGQ
jgi:Ca2+-binding EF-hand superfamily protein